LKNICSRQYIDNIVLNKNTFDLKQLEEYQTFDQIVRKQKEGK